MSERSKILSSGITNDMFGVTTIAAAKRLDRFYTQLLECKISVDFVIVGKVA